MVLMRKLRLIARQGIAFIVIDTLHIPFHTFFPKSVHKLTIYFIYTVKHLLRSLYSSFYNGLQDLGKGQLYPSFKDGCFSVFFKGNFAEF